MTRRTDRDLTMSIKNIHNKDKHASSYTISGQNSLEQFKSKVKQHELAKIRHSEAYFNNLKDYFEFPISKRSCGPLYTDFDSWNGLSTSSTYYKRNMTKDWTKWYKMAAADRHDNENIDNLLYKIFIFTRLIFHRVEYWKIVQFKFQQIKMMRIIFIFLKSSNQ